MTLLITVGLLVVVSSQCGNWTVTNPDDGSLVTLDLKPLHGVVLDIVDTAAEPHHYIYSICANNETCKGDKVMARVTSPSNPSACYIIGRWNFSKQPEYQDINGGEWTFVYDNGDDDCGNPARTWSPKFVCNPAVDYRAGSVDEIPNSCFYEVEIETRYACPYWTTTTTAIPAGECVFRSENGNHTLNMTSIKGKLLSHVYPNNEYLYYMYTPCVNAAKCNDNAVMAYVFDGMNFDCKQSLAVWEDGFVEPNYIEGIWQFTYTNGQPCNGGQTIFNVEWFCNKSAIIPQIIQAKEIATCVYQMVINSALACD